MARVLLKTVESVIEPGFGLEFELEVGLSLLGIA